MQRKQRPRQQRSNWSRGSRGAVNGRTSRRPLDCVVLHPPLLVSTPPAAASHRSTRIPCHGRISGKPPATRTRRVPPHLSLLLSFLFLTFFSRHSRRSRTPLPGTPPPPCSASAPLERDEIGQSRALRRLPTPSSPRQVLRQAAASPSRTPLASSSSDARGGRRIQRAPARPPVDRASASPAPVRALLPRPLLPLHRARARLLKPLLAPLSDRATESARVDRAHSTS
ncbi:uncharacterized protein [Triticum aestivum]|uniref:uncharacterized protein n=1 Tax=Triticum aestivum TaxID=4565 RepID=UPI001D02D92C|nr:uncharacterized protein LOC123072025 [Triticum aestivum]